MLLSFTEFPGEALCAAGEQPESPCLRHRLQGNVSQIVTPLWLQVPLCRVHFKINTVEKSILNLLARE